MSMSSTDKGLLTPGNCAVIFIDLQPGMLFGAVGRDWEDLLRNVLVLAKAAKLLKTGSAKKKKDAAFARGLILRSRDMSSVPPGTKVLYPSEYEVRANALILARELVGGIIVAGDK